MGAVTAAIFDDTNGNLIPAALLAIVRTALLLIAWAIAIRDAARRDGT